MEMFDEHIATLIKADGTIEQKRWVTEDTVQSEVMDDACRAFLAAERRDDLVLKAKSFLQVLYILGFSRCITFFPCAV